LQKEWTSDCLYRLIDHRWFHSLPTVYATNLSLVALKEAIGERVVSRVLDGLVVRFTGDDRRGGVR
jgi:DNA replication protein DnaC